MPFYAVFAVSALLVFAIVVRWMTELRRHLTQLGNLPLRVHVNGIRGKSTVTRLIAGLLREAGVKAVAKCTGSATTLIRENGREEPILRRGAPTILEQIGVISRQVPLGTEAVVMECMALRPQNQRVSETQIVRSNIGVITNVREDHQDVMGATLPEIARSLLSTCPYQGVLVTAEQDPAILAIMRQEATRRSSRLVVADPDEVRDDEIQGFSHIEFKDNVAIGLAIARLLNIPRATAMRGMQNAAPDCGALQLTHLQIGSKKVTWASLFAVNDRESTVMAVKMLEPFMTDDTVTVGLLNNRSDREQRALQFADIASRDLQFDRLVTLGAYEGPVSRRLVQNGFPADHVIQLGEQQDPTLKEMIQRIVLDMPKSHVLLVGLVNIHTKQAEMLLKYLEHRRQARKV